MHHFQGLPTGDGHLAVVDHPDALDGGRDGLAHHSTVRRGLRILYVASTFKLVNSILYLYVKLL